MNADLLSKEADELYQHGRFEEAIPLTREPWSRTRKMRLCGTAEAWPYAAWAGMSRPLHLLNGLCK
jgi:hypothetical protein